MIFEFPLLIFGTAAAAIPIIVHLINKSQYHEVKWGAMHLIELTLQSRQRRLRFENWLLMLLRCLLLVLLALLMANPTIPGKALPIALWIAQPLNYLITFILCLLLYAAALFVPPGIRFGRPQSKPVYSAGLVVSILFLLPLTGLFIFIIYHMVSTGELFGLLCLLPLALHLFAFFIMAGNRVHHSREDIIWKSKLVIMLGIIGLLTFGMVLYLAAYNVGTAKLTGGFWGKAKSSIVLVLDNSYSMDYEENGGTNFELARQAAVELVNKLEQGSEVNVVLMSSPGQPLYEAPIFNRKNVVADLAKLEAGYGQADVPTAIETAAEQAKDMEHPRREVVVISDFQRLSWASGEAPARERVARQLAKLKVPPHLTLLRVGAEGHENVSVESLEFSHLLLGVNQTVQVRANLRNFGEIHHDALEVAFHVDGEQKGVTQIPLGAGETRQVLFTHRFAQPGSHVVEVVTDADSLKADNVYRKSLPVWDSVPVLVVDGDPSTEPLRGETDFLQIALQPYREGQAKELVDLLEARVVPVAGFNRAAIGETRVVVLANVAKLALPQLTELQAFVRDGGGLLIFSGDQMDHDWYNDQMRAFHLLPSRLAAVEDRSGDPEPFTRIVVRRFEHPALRIFNDQRNGDLAAAEIRQWVRTIEEPDNSLINTPARLDGGDAFLVEQIYGNGRVLFCATTCDDAWSNLPGRTFFVPFAQRLCTYLASAVMPPRNLGVGQEAIAHFPLQTAGTEVKMKDSEGREHSILIRKSGGRGVARFTETQRPGLYTLAGPGGAPVHFVVNTGRAESDLTQLSGEELAAVAKEMKAQLVTSLEDYRAVVNKRRDPLEIWPVFFAFLVFILFFELWLQRRMAQQR